jgi:DNA-binding MarR family transcriptional regulator
MTAPRDLGRLLHALTARLDRTADRILRTEQGISYSRFLALWAVGELNGPTQRALADWLGLTEPSVSRTTALLAAEGLLAVEGDPAGGNRRRLTLTRSGEDLVSRCGRLLETTLDDLVDRAGLSHDRYRRDTVRLLDILQEAPGPTLAGA